MTLEKLGMIIVPLQIRPPS